MKAKEIFEKYRDDYVKAYENANNEKYDGYIKYENGWVLLSEYGAKCRAKELPVIIERLNKRAENQKNKTQELPTFKIETKLNIKVKELPTHQSDWAEVYLGDVKMGHTLELINYTQPGYDWFVWVNVAVSYKINHKTKDDAIQELIEVAEAFVNKLNE